MRPNILKHIYIICVCLNCVKQTNSMCVPSLALCVLCDPSGRVLVSYYQIMHEWWGKFSFTLGLFLNFPIFHCGPLPLLKSGMESIRIGKKNIWWLNIFQKEKISTGPVLHGRSGLIGEELYIKSILWIAIWDSPARWFTSYICTAVHSLWQNSSSIKLVYVYFCHNSTNILVYQYIGTVIALVLLKYHQHHFHD